MFGLGQWELIAIFVLVLVIFGPKNLPRIGQSLGKGIREFKDAAQGLMKEEENQPPQQRIEKQNVSDKNSEGNQPSA